MHDQHNEDWREAVVGFKVGSVTAHQQREESDRDHAENDNCGGVDTGGTTGFDLVSAPQSVGDDRSKDYAKADVHHVVDDACSRERAPLARVGHRTFVIGDCSFYAGKLFRKPRPRRVVVRFALILMENKQWLDAIMCIAKSRYGLS